MELVRIHQLDKREIEKLINDKEGISISLTMPVQHEPDKRDENRIRLKNLLQRSEKELAVLDYRRPDIEELLAPARDLDQTGLFLDSNGPGLAIYLGHDFSRAYELPFAAEEMVMVGSQFLIKPLMPALQKEYFYILALSQEDVRLLRATQFTAERMDLGDMPQSLDEALRWDDPERQLQWHSKSAPSGRDTDRNALFHGHGSGDKENQKENLLRYFRLLDQGLSKILAGESRPLIMAGVDYLLPLFREASAYESIIEENISGSAQSLSDAELQEAGWKLMREHLVKAQESVDSMYQEQASKDLASSDLSAVIPAARQGRVDRLFVTLNEMKWGEYDPETGETALHAEPQPGDVDLLNVATIYTYLNSGEIDARQREEMPDEQDIAAIFRY